MHWSPRSILWRYGLILLRNNSHLPQPGKLSPEALMSVDAIRETSLANLDRAQDRLLGEVQHVVHERPVRDLLVRRREEAVAGNHRIPQRSLLGHLRGGRHRQRLRQRDMVEVGQLAP